MLLTPEILERLRIAMQQKKVTGYTIKKELGISATTVSNYFKKKIKKADTIKLNTICKFLDITIEWLEFGDNQVREDGSKEAKPETITLPGTDFYLREIYEKMLVKDNFYQVIHNDIRGIDNEIKELKKEVTALKAEIKKLKKK